MSAPEMTRPDWAESFDIDSQPPANTTLYSVRWPKRAIALTIALAVALTATIALAIVATASMESDITATREQISDLEAKLGAAEQHITEVEAERDLADEAWSQAEYQATTCHVAADAATSLVAGWEALDDNDVASANGWLDDTKAILDSHGYDTVGEAWTACDNGIA